MEGMVTADGYVTYVCEAGYTMHVNPASNDDYVKAATVRCGANGEWHVNNMVCLRKSLLCHAFGIQLLLHVVLSVVLAPTKSDRV